MYDDVSLFLILGISGLVIGACGGIRAAKKGKSLLVAIGLSTLVAVVLPLLVWFTWTVIKTLQSSAYTPAEALKAGVNAMLLLLASVPFATGPPAAISSGACFLLTRKRSQGSK